MIFVIQPKVLHIQSRTKLPLEKLDLHLSLTTKLLNKMRFNNPLIVEDKFKGKGNKNTKRGVANVQKS